MIKSIKLVVDDKNANLINADIMTIKVVHSNKPNELFYVDLTKLVTGGFFNDNLSNIQAYKILTNNLLVN